MKLNKIFLLAGLALVGFASCSDDDDYAAGPQAPAGADGAYFNVEKATTPIEKEPSGDCTFQVAISRVDTTEAATVEIEVLQNDSNVFSVPEVAEFAANQKTTTITVEPKNFVAGLTYVLSLKLKGDQVNPYTSEAVNAAFEFTAIKWNDLGKGYITDGAISAWFGGAPSMMSINLQYAETSAGLRYRFVSPYNKILGETDEADENGAYIANDWNEGPGDLTVSDDIIWAFDVDEKGKITINGGLWNLGINYGYGEIQLLSAYGANSPKEDAYLDAEAGIAVFPAQSLFSNMTENGASYSAAFKIYLSVKAYEDEQALSGEEGGDEEGGGEGGGEGEGDDEEGGEGEGGEGAE